MSQVGYARVSSVGQSLDVQLEKLRDCHEIFQEKVSGLDDKRPQLAECLKYLRKGDTLIVTKLDRLARSTVHLWKIAEVLNEKGVELKVLDQNVDTSTSTGRLLFNMLGVIAQFETEIRSERQADGIRRAKSKGIHFGRTYKLTEEQGKELYQKRQSGIKIKDLMKEYDLSKASLYQYLNKATLKSSMLTP